MNLWLPDFIEDLDECEAEYDEVEGAKPDPDDLEGSRTDYSLTDLRELAESLGGIDYLRNAADDSA